MKGLVILALLILVIFSNIVSAQSGMVGYWELDEGSGSMTMDNSGHGNNGNVNGAIWTEGKHGYAMQFDGVDDYVNVPNSASLNANYTTISAWIYPKGNATNSNIVRKGVSSTSNYALDLRGTTHLMPAIFFYNSTGSLKFLQSSSAISLNTWTHLAGVYNGTHLILYENGVATDISGASGIPVVAGDVNIGGLSSAYLNGIIDEVRIYNRALSSNEIQNTYLDESKNYFFGRLVDKNGSPVQATITSGSLTNSTDPNGNYFLRIPSGSCDIQYDTSIQNFYVKLSLNSVRDVKDLINSITWLQNKTTFSLEASEVQTVQTYSETHPSRVLVNDTALLEVSSLSSLTDNTWFYDSTEKKLYLKINSTSFNACTCSSWTNGACNSGGCTNQRQQTRTCTPTGCTPSDGLGTSRCIADVSCQTCSDGTLYGQCSSNKPKYCNSGSLIDKCSQCGCSSGTCQPNETCTPQQEKIKGVQWYRVKPYTSSDSIQSLQELRTNIPDNEWIGFDVFIDFSGNSATRRTALESEYVNAIQQAHDAGLKVRMRIQPRPWNYGPPDINAWFPNFKNAVGGWADFAESNNVEALAVATEMFNVEQYNTQWTDLVQNIRTRFSGYVSYNTNFWWQDSEFNRKKQATWMGLLDWIEVSSYWKMCTSPEPSVQTLVNNWDNYVGGGDFSGESIVDSLKELGDTHNKQILIVTGLASAYGNCETPWEYDFNSYTPSIIEQRNWYDAVLSVFSGKDWIKGFIFDGAWHSSIITTLTDLGYPQDEVNFNTRGKNTQQIIENRFENLSA